MKRFMLTVALTLTLSVSALAGEIPTVTNVTSNIPPPPVSAATSPGEEPTIPGAELPDEEPPGILELLTLALIGWL